MLTANILVTKIPYLIVGGVVTVFPFLTSKKCSRYTKKAKAQIKNMKNVPLLKTHVACIICSKKYISFSCSGNHIQIYFCKKIIKN